MNFKKKTIIPLFILFFTFTFHAIGSSFSTELEIGNGKLIGVNIKKEIYKNLSLGGFTEYDHYIFDVTGDDFSANLVGLGFLFDYKILTLQKKSNINLLARLKPSYNFLFVKQESYQDIGIQTSLIVTYYKLQFLFSTDLLDFNFDTLSTSLGLGVVFNF